MGKFAKAGAPAQRSNGGDVGGDRAAILGRCSQTTGQIRTLTVSAALAGGGSADPHQVTYTFVVDDTG